MADTRSMHAVFFGGDVLSTLLLLAGLRVVEGQSQAPTTKGPVITDERANRDARALIHLPRGREERSDITSSAGGERWLILGRPGEEETLRQVGYIYQLGDEALEEIGPGAARWRAEFGFELPGLGGLMLAGKTFAELLDLVALHAQRYGVKVLDREGSPYRPSWRLDPRQTLGMTVVEPDHLKGAKVERVTYSAGDYEPWLVLDRTSPALAGEQIAISPGAVQLVRDPTTSPWSA